MVLGLRSKHRKDTSLQVDYLVHVKEIKPWPPSQSLRSVQSVLLQWENGDHNSGSLASGVGDLNIEFNESFMLSTSLCREKRARDNFQKNCLEFYLYEHQKDKAAKGKHLGTAIINLADYGIVKETLTFSAPVSCKKSSRNTAQPVLFFNIQPFDKNSSTSSPRGTLSKEASLDMDGGESVSETVNEENDDESEIASFTDDDVSSHSSRTISSSAFEATKVSAPQNEESGSGSTKYRTGRGSGEPSLPLGVEPAKSVEISEAKLVKQANGSSQTLSSTVFSSDLANPVNRHASKSKYQERNLIPIQKGHATPFVQSSSSSLDFPNTNEASSNCITSFEQEDITHEFHDEIYHSRGNFQDDYVDKLAAKVTVLDTHVQVGANSNLNSRDSPASREYYEEASRGSKNEQLNATIVNDIHAGPMEGKEKKEQRDNRQDKQILEDNKSSSENKLVGNSSQGSSRKHWTQRSDTFISSRRDHGVQGTAKTNNKLRHLKSVQLPYDSGKANEFLGTSQIIEKVREIEILEDANNTATGNVAAEIKEAKDGFADSKTEWKSRIKILEEELREAAALEASLYSVVAEHGSSTNKVHAPARRLSRFYLHAWKARSQSKRATAARGAVSGLVLVSKACGNDVPRLTFWLSNSIMLREIVKHSVEEMPLSGGPCIENNGSEEGSAGRFTLKRDDYSSVGKGKNSLIKEFEDWEDLQTFMVALEKVEAWIFSRIVESVWWQTLTPHMQSTAAKTSGGARTSSSRKISKSTHVLGDHDQGNFSMELWKKAFRDACERLCPIRAGGHECGCLPVLAKLVMEQLVDRLDVAMFNAILRESSEEMPTDPVSDPISEPRVLPIPAGKSSFGAGAQLKNAIGSWSRWLTDLFGIEDSDSTRCTNNLGNDNGLDHETSFKAFRLLNALSDLMMLPFDMLADKSTRKEVCPIFLAPLIKRVLNNFAPDEFCPDPVPVAILDALDAEDAPEAAGESFTSFPCIATPTVYSPPTVASLAGFMGEVGSQTLQKSWSLVLRKAYTSDDELDELDSPITSIVLENSRLSSTSTKPDWMPKGEKSQNVVRYKLLREVWRDSE
ncbi:uncharacterized protein LOC132276238 [Cornus florida]|uniref:uncharacterized protein LOC132276238 n=1 Tax=Cornus florida TaxID=4283 RepID=UPI00289C8A80|nr:uncharacterized protein LOC132276238 [Cornus florida]